MKSLLILLMFPCTLYAQVQVNSKKEITIAKSMQTELACIITNGDTTYMLSFKDARYPSLREYEAVQLKKKEVLDLADALIELSKEKHPAGESDVKVAGVVVYKEKMFGQPYLRINKGGAYTNFTNMKKSNSFADDIYDFFGID